MEKLTSRQKKAFEFIRDHTLRHGFAPTLRELCAFMGYKAVGSAQDMIASLRKKGFLQIPAKQTARSLILTDKARQFDRQSVFELDQEQEFLTIPCLGSVPAGNPLEAIEDPIGYLNVSPHLLPRPQPQRNQLFALRARGLSMQGAGILDGDWLIIRSQQEAPSGSIVVARTAGDATVKRLVMDDELGWCLKPENPDFQAIYANQSAFEIIGKVIGLQRSYD